MLSDSEKEAFGVRHADLSLDEAKNDLKRPFRWVYGSLGRNRRPTEWVVETEVREQRRRVQR